MFFPQLWWGFTRGSNLGFSTDERWHYHSWGGFISSHLYLRVEVFWGGEIHRMKLFDFCPTVFLFILLPFFFFRPSWRVLVVIHVRRTPSWPNAFTCSVLNVWRPGMTRDRGNAQSVTLRSEIMTFIGFIFSKTQQKGLKHSGQTICWLKRLQVSQKEFKSNGSNRNSLCLCLVVSANLRAL